MQLSPGSNEQCELLRGREVYVSDDWSSGPLLRYRSGCGWGGRSRRTALCSGAPEIAVASLRIQELLNHPGARARPYSEVCEGADEVGRSHAGYVKGVT